MENKSNREWSYFIGGVVVIIAIILFIPVNIQRTISFTGKIIPSKTLLVYYDRDGRLVKKFSDNNNQIVEMNLITFDRGDDFKISTFTAHGLNDTLLVVSSYNIDEQLIDLHSQLNELNYYRRAVITGEKSEKISELQNKLNIARSEFVNIIKKYERADSLHNKGLISDEEFENAKTIKDIAALKIKVSEYQLKYAQSGVKPEDIDYIDAQIESVKRELELLKGKKTDYVIINPFHDAINLTGTGQDTLIYLAEADEYSLFFPLLTGDASLLDLNSTGFIYNTKEDSIKIKLLTVSNNIKMLNNKPVKLCTAKILGSQKEKLNIGAFAEGEFNAGEESISEFLIRSIH